MVDLSPQIVAALDTIPELNQRVYDHHPYKDAEFPCVSFKETNNVPDLSAANEETTSQIEYEITVWDRDKATVKLLSAKVNAKMQDLKFIRTFAFWYLDGNIWRRVLRYTKITESEVN